MYPVHLIGATLILCFYFIEFWTLTCDCNQNMHCKMINMLVFLQDTHQSYECYCLRFLFFFFDREATLVKINQQLYWYNDDELLKNTNIKQVCLTQLGFISASASSEVQVSYTAAYDAVCQGKHYSCLLLTNCHTSRWQRDKHMHKQVPVKHLPHIWV